MIAGSSVVLINPSAPAHLPNKEFVLPLSLLYLAATLEKAGFDVKILDLNIFRAWERRHWPGDWWKPHVLAQIEACRPLFVGIGCLYSGQFNLLRRIARYVKELDSTVPVVIGGMHPTVFASEIISHCQEIDYVAIGEGEPQIVALARFLRGGTPKPLDTVDGLAMRREGRLSIRPKQNFLRNLDQLPPPAYPRIDFQDYEHDTRHWHNPKRHRFNLSVPLISSRSCPNRCSFCSMYQVMGPKLRKRSATAVVDEIQQLYEGHGLTHFSFMDDNLNLNKKHILAICGEILRRNIDIQYETPNGLSTAHLDEEIMDAMAASGWVRGAIAIESGSDYIRNEIMGKRLPRERIFRVVHYAKRLPQLYLKAYFVIGMPEETHGSLDETYRMIADLELDEAYVTNLMPFAGTKVFQQAVRDGLLDKSIDLANLWKTDGFHYHDNHRFYIKPYNMGFSELSAWRRKFDALLQASGRKSKRMDDPNVQPLHKTTRTA